MTSPDWHDALSALAAQLAPGDPSSTSEDLHPATQHPPVQSSPVHIALERKGRGGKTATIIYDLDLADPDLKNLAADLKRSLGCGGSSRGGEILIQGDRVTDCRKFLTARGFIIK